MVNMENSDPTPSEVKNEPPSPVPSEQSETTSNFSSEYTNCNGNAEGMDGGNHTDAPLDFSMKKTGREEDHEQITDYRIKSEHDHLASQENGVSGDESSNTSMTSDMDARIGQPQTAMPGTLPGTTFPVLPQLPPGFPNLNGLPPAAAAGILAQGLGQAFPLQFLDPRRVQSQGTSGNKNTRPFKAYPKDPLSLPLGYYGIPGLGVPLPGMEGIAPNHISANSEELFNIYRQQILKSQGKNNTNNRDRDRDQARANTSNSSSTSQAISSPPITTSPSNASTTSTPATSPISGPPTQSQNGSSARKRPRTLPDSQKDEAYWERRRKNNDAAKRSRDARRAKEDEIAIRAAFLEQENLKLRVEVAALKNETAKLRCMLYNS